MMMTVVMLKLQLHHLNTIPSSPTLGRSSPQLTKFDLLFQESKAHTPAAGAAAADSRLSAATAVPAAAAAVCLEALWHRECCVEVLGENRG